MSTVVGGQAESASAFMPSSFSASLTVGMAAAGNLSLRPSTSRPPAWGFVLIVCPSIAATTAWRAALARRLVERNSASSEIASEARARLRERRSLIPAGPADRIETVAPRTGCRSLPSPVPAAWIVCRRRAAHLMQLLQGHLLDRREHGLQRDTRERLVLEQGVGGL